LLTACTSSSSQVLGIKTMQGALRTMRSPPRLHASVMCVAGTAEPAHVARAVAIEFKRADALGGGKRLVVAGKRGALLQEELLSQLPLSAPLRAVWPGLIADLADSTTKSVRRG
jgi:hypothetical protein